MAEAFLGEIRMMAFSFPPRDWAMCNGQTMPINQNQALFSLLGTNYGGNGQTTFALPDLRGRVPLHFGNVDNPIGTPGGTERVTVTSAQMPAHSHALNAAGPTGNSNNIGGGNKMLAADPAAIYAPGLGSSPVQLNGGTIDFAGSGQPHENRQPFTVVNFCISTAGIYPSRSN